MTPQHAYYYNASREIMDTAKRLRKNMTPAEKLLWHELKGNKINGRHFRRQHPIYRYIADFYYHKEKLVIEVDGLYHNNPEQRNYDKNRDATMNEYEIKVLRFTNKEILTQLDKVLERIKEVCG
ncbi:MAG: endonuclease domain-containing protein [Bacteroidia bacterium]|nr:endonuclease domain-containing protein [Bacteroidia bacterium]